MKKILFSAMMLLMATSIAFAQQPTRKLRFVNKSNPNQVVQPSTGTSTSATTQTEHLNIVYGRIDGRDTLLYVYLPEVDIDLMCRYYEITSTRQGRRLANNVKKVYPYAKLAGEKMKEFDAILAEVSDASERKRMMKEAEDELTSQYTEELKKLNFSQGAILIRLIDRETGNTSYQVVRELRGRLRAFFYQGFARLWGYNLKSEYDPHNNPEDDNIETIVTLLERGQI